MENIAKPIKGNYYYTDQGLYVRFLEEVSVNNKPQFVVIDERDESDGEGGVDTTETAHLVYRLYENESSTPIAVRRSELQESITKLYAEKQVIEKELSDAKTIKKSLRYDFNPKFQVGQEVFEVKYGGEMSKDRIVSIVFYVDREKSHIEYKGSDGYARNFFATIEEATEESTKVKEAAEKTKKEREELEYERAKDIVNKWEK